MNSPSIISLSPLILVDRVTEASLGAITPEQEVVARQNELKLITVLYLSFDYKDF